MFESIIERLIRQTRSQKYHRVARAQQVMQVMWYYRDIQSDSKKICVNGSWIFFVVYNSSVYKLSVKIKSNKTYTHKNFLFYRFQWRLMLSKKSWVIKLLCNIITNHLSLMKLGKLKRYLFWTCFWNFLDKTVLVST